MDLDQKLHAQVDTGTDWRWDSDGTVIPRSLLCMTPTQDSQPGQTPNVSRLLRAWGIADIIGDNLVHIEELNMRRRDGTRVGYTPMKRVENALGQPWWVVHRAHLHEGLVEVAKDPVARDLVEKLTMEVWMSDNSYIISYPISNGTQFNMVLSHHRPNYVNRVEKIDMQELRDTYQDYDRRIKRIVDMVPEAQRWPLMVTGPLKTWSTPSRNVVLMGDAAHSMANHMAQGAATSMEDGAFLGKTMGEVVKGTMTIAEAVELYEKERIPNAYFKQQVSFINEAIWQLPDGPEQRARDAAMLPELNGQPFMRSPNLYGDPATVLEVYGYDAEAHAESAITRYLQRYERAEPQVGVTKLLEDKYMNWFLPAVQEEARQ